MKYRYFVEREGGVRLPFRVLDADCAAFLGDKYEETTFADWWENGLSMESRASYISVENPHTFTFNDEVLSLTDGEPVMSEETSDVPPVTL